MRISKERQMTRDALLALLKRVERSPDGGEPDGDEIFGGFGCNICGNVWRESIGGVNHDASCELKAAIDWLEDDDNKKELVQVDNDWRRAPIQIGWMLLAE
jgi:hypothetical protein